MELGKAEEIAENLRKKILDGTLAPGTKIASERELSDELEASRMTVRHALEIIEGEGLVTRYPGRGTFVSGDQERILVTKGREVQKKLADQSITGGELRMSGSFLKDMERVGRKPQVKFLEQPSLVAADTKIAQHLQIPIGTFVLKRYRLQLADNTPYRIIESYYPSDLFGELLTIDIKDKPLFAWLQERHKLKAAHAQETLIGRLATQNERQHLRISLGAPIIEIERTVQANTQRTIEWARIIAVASRYTFTYEYDISEWNIEEKADEGDTTN